MRKIVAFLISSLVAFSWGYSITLKSLELLIGWLAPIFGTSIRVFLSMAFIILGDPFKFVTLTLLWASVGILCGLIVRRRIGSVIVSWLVYSAILFIMVIAILRMFEIASDIGLLEKPELIMSRLPPLPPETTLSTILDAPIINDVYRALQGVSFAEMPPITEVGYRVLSAIILNPIKIALILMVSSLIGCEVGRFIEAHITDLKRAFRIGSIKMGGGVKRLPPTVLLSLSILVIMNLLIPSFCTNQRLEDPYYAEGIFGFVTPDGTVYLLSAFIDSEMSISGINLSSPEFEDALIGVLISHDTSAITLPPILFSPSLLGTITPANVPSTLLGNLIRYYEIVPKTILLLAYVDLSEDEARVRADAVKSIFSTAFGIALSYLSSITREIELAGTVHTLNIIVYQSAATLAEVSPNIMRILPTDKDGLATIIDHAYKSGILTPRSTNISSNGTIMVAGFLSPPVIMSLLEGVESIPLELIGLVMPNTTTPIPVLSTFSYWINRIHSSSFEHTINIAEILNYTEPIQFSPMADISAISIAATNATIHDGRVVSQKPIVSLIVSANLTEPEFKPILNMVQAINQTATTKVFMVGEGATIEAEKSSLSFIQILPLNLRVKKEVSPSLLRAGEEAEITIEITNLDEDPAENVTLNDSLLTSYYGPISIEVLEGNLTRRWAEIPGNSTVIHKYKIRVRNEGIYTIPYAEVRYSYSGLRFLTKSNNVYVRAVGAPLITVLASGIPTAWNTLTRILDRIPSLRGRGSLILALAVSIIIIPIALNLSLIHI